MDMHVTDPAKGVRAFVTDQHQLQTKAENISQQHFIAKEFGQTFQAEGLSVTLTSATHTVLHLKNDDPARKLVVSYIRTQVIAANASNLLSDRFEIGLGRTVTSDGTAVTPINTNAGSGVVASVTATEGAGTTPTMAGTFLGLDTWYPDSGNDRNTYNKSGSVILGLGDTLEIRYVGTSTAGNAYARVTFMMIDNDD